MAVHSLLSAGSNAKGQLATGDSEDAHSFAQTAFRGHAVGVLPDGTECIAQVACGANHTLVVLDRIRGSPTETTRELWGCGDGGKGQLGLAYDVSNTSILRPLNLDLESLSLREYTVQTVAACWETSFVALSHPNCDDVLLSMGADDYGDLGVGGAGKAMQRSGMIHVVKLKEAVPVLQENKDYTLKIGTLTSGPHHVVIHLTLTCTDGMEEQHVLGWGTARHGQIGPHKDPSTGKPVPFLPSPTPLFSADSQGNESLVSSALGTHHTVLLLSSGRLQPLGSNRKGQLDGVDSLQDVAAVGCTWNGTYAAVRRGNSWSIISAGNHNKGQLGRPVQFGDNNPHGHSLAVHFPFSHETHSLVKMACGSEHILCLFSRKEADSNDRPLTEVWGWGWNEHGNLGIGTIQDTDAPIKIWPTAADHRIAVDVWAGNGTSWILV